MKFYMLKITFIIPLLLCLSQNTLFAQDWIPFPLNQKTWFEFSNEEHFSISQYYATKLIEEENKKHYYFDPNKTTDFFEPGSNCLTKLESNTVDFISVENPYTEIDGQYFYKDQLAFDTNLTIGESIIVTSSQNTSFTELQIKCVAKDITQIFGLQDSIKIFNLQAYNNDEPVESAFDDFEYILSKNYGFIKFLPFIELLEIPKTTATLKRIEKGDQVYGKPVIDEGNFLPTFKPGSIIYSTKLEDQWFFDDTTLISNKDSITQINLDSNRFTITFDRMQIVKGREYPFDPYPIEIDTTYTFDNSESILLYNIPFEELDKSIWEIDKSIYGLTLENPDDAANSLFKFTRKLSYQQTCSFLPGKPHSYNILMQRLGIVQCSTPSLLVLHNLYNNNLGMIKIFYSTDTGFNSEWNLEIYQNGNETYTPFETINSSYNNTDEPIDLINYCHHRNEYYTSNDEAIVGPGVVNGTFSPALVPDSLLNIPFDITFNIGLFQFKHTVTVNDNPTSILSNNIPNYVVEIFPNPASDKIYVKALKTGNSPAIIKLINIKGQLIEIHSFDSFLNKENLEINVKNLPKGIYFFEITQQKYKYNKKILIE